MGKFSELYEEVYQRYEKTSAIPGDYVKIRSNVKSSDWYKNLDEARKAYVDNIIQLQEAGKYILFSAIKSTQYETNKLGSKEFIADITVEEAPGLYNNALSLPIELVEFDMTGEEHRATRTDKTNEKQENITAKPEPVEDPELAVGNSSKIDGGDYKLASENYTSKYMS
jgi:hypothetical protein